MAVTAEGQDINDVRRQVFDGARRPWITIHPYHSLDRDYRGPGADRFIIECTLDAKGGSFNQTLNRTGALKAIAELLKYQESFVLERNRKVAANDRAFRQGQIKALRRALRLAEKDLKRRKKQLKEIEKGGDIKCLDPSASAEAEKGLVPTKGPTHAYTHGAFRA